MNDSDEEFFPHVDPAPPPLEIWWQEEKAPRRDEPDNDGDTRAHWVEK